VRVSLGLVTHLSQTHQRSRKLAFLCQDQWDIYKLDPYYECTVRPIPSLSTIRVAEPRVKPPSNSQNKRAYDSGIPLEDEHPAKRFHRDVTMASIRSSDDEDEEVQVEAMVTDVRGYRDPVSHTASRPPASPVAPQRVKVPMSPPESQPIGSPPPTFLKPMSHAAQAPPPPAYSQSRQSHSVPPESQKKRKGARHRQISKSTD